MTTDRSGLESAVAIADRLLSDEDRAPGTYIPMTAAHLDQLRHAARKHLDTLPRTKMVEVKRWVSFDHIYEGCGDGEDAHLITRLRAFVGEQDGPGQWVTFTVEVPA